MSELALALAAVLSAGTLLALASLGLLVHERAGVVNLGAEGMLLLSALAGYAVCEGTESQLLGFVAAACAGALAAALFGVLAVLLATNQYATGLALSLFGAGLSAFAGTRYTDRTLVARPHFDWFGLSELPLIGPALFKQHPLVYLTILLGFGLAWFFKHARLGLVLRAAGESPESAHALGYDVQRVRMLAVIVGGALCGLSGGYLSLVYTPLWVEGISAGRGYIALALTTFASWRPLRVLLGAYLFAGVTTLQFHLQGHGVAIPSQALSMLPYLSTIVVLALISRDASFVRRNMPAALGKPFSKTA
jgi:simple sugar transport system permease protein